LKIKFDYNKSLYKTTFNFVMINVSDIIFETLNSPHLFHLMSPLTECLVKTLVVVKFYFQKNLIIFYV